MISPKDRLRKDHSWIGGYNMNIQNNCEVEFADDRNYEEETEKVNPESIPDVVLNATDWTTETVLAQLKRGNIDLNPRFQRRDAWTVSRKSRFIESLILGLPIPQIVLAERKNERGRYLVLDGKQRLLALLQFIGVSEGKFNLFKLKGLEVREDLINKNFSDFENDIFENDLNAFYNQTIRTVVIRSWPNVNFLHMVFLRLNTSSTQLSPQELRQALFPGVFTDYIDDRATQSQQLLNLLKLKEPDFRMRDVEILVRYVAFKNFLNEYAGNMRAFLDMTCDKLNQNWELKSDLIDNQILEFEKAIDTAKDIFGENNIGRKWTADGFETRLNRAVLDVITYYFSEPEIRQAAKDTKGDVLQAFQSICVHNDDFKTSIETTTKSLTATYNRLSIWGNNLNDVLNIDVKVPSWDEDKKRILYP